MCCVVRPTAAFELGLNRATWLMLFVIFYVSVFTERLFCLDIGWLLTVWCWSWGDKSFYSCKSSLKSSLAYVTSLLVSSENRRRPIPLMLQNIVRCLKRSLKFATLIKLSLRFVKPIFNGWEIENSLRRQSTKMTLQNSKCVWYESSLQENLRCLWWDTQKNELI